MTGHLYRHASIIVGTRVGFATHILRAGKPGIRACAGYARLYAWLGTRVVATSHEITRRWALSMFAQLHLHPPCVLRPTVYTLQSGDTEICMSYAQGFLATCP
jgi:hypothetical protein